MIGGMGTTTRPTTPAQEAAQNAAMPSNFYSASGNFAAKTVSVAADRYKLLTPADGAIKIAGETYYWTTQQTLDLSLETTWDTIVGTDHRTAGNRAGKDFYVYACQPGAGVTTPIFLVSANASAPSGYTTANSRLVGGFHCLCVAVAHATTLTAWAADTVIAVGETRKPTVWNGKIIRCTIKAGDFKTNPTTEPDVAGAAVGATLVDDQITWIVEQHALEGYVAGDILPASVWDWRKRPSTLVPGLLKIPGFNSWGGIYDVSGTLVAPTSVLGGTILHNVSAKQLHYSFLNVGLRLPTIEELLATIFGGAPGLLSPAADPNTSAGRVDAYGRRDISFCGAEGAGASHSQWSTTPATAANRFMSAGNYAAYSELSDVSTYAAGSVAASVAGRFFCDGIAI